MEEFESCLHQEDENENFEKHDDLTDWQFSLEALKWWKEKAKDLENVER